MKNYVIRYRDIPLAILRLQKFGSEGEWYYCNKSDTVLYGCWRHKSELKHLIISDLNMITERFNKINGIYKNLVIDEVRGR